jgi:hypothetical protein
LFDLWNEEATPILDKADSLQELGNIIHMDGQVCNGGFYQWVANGYASGSIEGCIKFVRAMDTPEAKVVFELLRKVYPRINLNVQNKGCFGDYFKDTKHRSYGSPNNGSADEEDFQDDSQEWDKLYYDINKKFMEQAAEILLPKLKEILK